MLRSSLRHTLTVQRFPGVTVAALAIALWLLAFSQPVPAQTFQVLHTFTFGLDGSQPWGGLAIDRRGNLYGTTIYGGTNNGGTVFELSRAGTGWTLHPLYSFNGRPDGVFPQAPLTVGTDGTLYGTTLAGGTSGFGTVFQVRPPANPCKTVTCFWTETVLHSFADAPDGATPGYGALVLDQAGNLYGTTGFGGVNEQGVAFQLARSGGSWTESVLYDFDVASTGMNPYSGLIFDSAGRLYGTTSAAGGGNGTAFQLFRTATGWAANVLYVFPQGQQTSKGANPYGTLIFDASGNLYGTTLDGGTGGSGTAYQLTRSGSAWTEPLVQSLSGVSGEGPRVGLAMDAAGNLYGTTPWGGSGGWGTVFKLTRSGDNWIYTDLHDFSDGTDGGLVTAGVTLDANGNIYGTAVEGGADSGACTLGCGVVWEITPN